MSDPSRELSQPSLCFAFEGHGAAPFGHVREDESLPPLSREQHHATWILNNIEHPTTEGSHVVRIVLAGGGKQA